MQSNYKEALKQLAKECHSVEDIQEKLRELFKDTLQQVFEAEMDEHLGYKKHDNTGDKIGNSRNGYSSKTIKSRYGASDVKIPRDRNGEFEPEIIKKHETAVNGLEEQIIAMYAKGMSTRDIEDHMRDIYGIDVSAGMVSKVRDKILPLVAEWQSRPLDRIYPIVFLDAIHFKVRKDNRIINKAAYSVLGINMAGHKEVLGIWIGENESANFWLGVCNDLRNRGVEDILIVSKDGLLCVIHQIRNSLKYVSYKDQKALMVDLKKVYKNPCPDAFHTVIEHHRAFACLASLLRSSSYEKCLPMY